MLFITSNNFNFCYFIRFITYIQNVREIITRKDFTDENTRIETLSNGRFCGKRREEADESRASGQVGHSSIIKAS